MDLNHARRIAETTPGIKAVMPVHLFGQAVDMDAWTKFADDIGAVLIEDAAQAIGTKDTTGAMAGSRGRVGCFSFFPSKNLGGFGDGGIVTTNDEQLAHTMTTLRVHGMEPKYYHPAVGVNGRLDALQAAVLRVKLRHLESWHDGRAANAAHYDQLFHAAGAIDSNTPLSEAPDALPLRTPATVSAPARHVYNQYVIRVPAEIRDGLREHLRSRNIATEVYYPVPLHLQECFSHLGGKPGDLPESESAAAETIALPIYSELTEAQREHVASSIVAYTKEHETVTSVAAS